MRMLLLFLAVVGTEATAETFELSECRTLDSVLSCPLTNSGDEAFRSFDYAIVALEDGRTFPWAEAAGGLTIPGGLEPGETVQVDLPLPKLPERAAGKDIQYKVSATPSSYDGLEESAKIAACWNVGALSMEALRTTVLVRFTVDARGVPDFANIALDSVDLDTSAVTQAFEAARRAIIRCGQNGGLEGGVWEFSPVGIRKIK